jgi:pSer/pThr/pTyr-binding forkhead associated (FHA) protein/S1-C subfamily serine protease
LSLILTIRHLSGSLAGKSQRVAMQDGQVLRLGRAAESDIRFSDTTEDSVSGIHAELTLEGQRLFIEDKRSSNGTFVNGAPCPPFQKVAVPDGSRIRLANQGPEMQVVSEAARPAAGRAAAAGTAATAAETAAAPAKESVGKATLLREIDRARQEERDHVSSELATSKKSNKALLAASLIGVLLLGAAAFGAYAWWSGRQAEERAAREAAQRQEEIQAAGNVWSAVESRVSPSVVHIRCVYRLRAANGAEWISETITGSGVQIRPGLILTARHVAEPWRFNFRGLRSDAGGYDPNDTSTWNWDELEEKRRLKAEYDRLEVQFAGRRPLKATLVSGTGPRTEDLALLQIQPTTAPAIDVDTSNSDVNVTDEIAIIGYPGELGQYALRVSNATGVGEPFPEVTEVVPTFMKGTVAQPLTGTGTSSHLLFFDASIEPGSSGGPVIDRRGKLIGIVSMQYNRRGDDFDFLGVKLPTWQPMEAGSIAVSPDDIQSFLHKHGIL